MLPILFVILLLPAILMRSLRNGWYVLHVGLVVAAAWRLGMPVALYAASNLLVLHLISINLVTVLAYAADKRAARRGGYRVSERTLHSLALIGGTPAAFLARKFLRHKTVKGTFIRDFWLTVLWQAVLLAVVWHVLG